MMSPIQSGGAKYIPAHHTLILPLLSGKMKSIQELLIPTSHTQKGEMKFTQALLIQVLHIQSEGIKYIQELHIAMSPIQLERINIHWDYHLYHISAFNMKQKAEISALYSIFNSSQNIKR